MSSGDILCWLNSDDYFLPGTLSWVSQNLDITKQQLLFGNCFRFMEGMSESLGSDVVKSHSEFALNLSDYVIQPSSFWTRNVWDSVGLLDDTLHYAFDWDWFIRASRSAVDFIPTNRYLSSYRIHDNHKTCTGGEKRVKEIGDIYLKYSDKKYYSS